MGRYGPEVDWPPAQLKKIGDEFRAIAQKFDAIGERMKDAGVESAIFKRNSSLQNVFLLLDDLLPFFDRDANRKIREKSGESPIEADIEALEALKRNREKRQKKKG